MIGSRGIRNVAFAALLLVSLAGVQKRVSAATCSNISASWSFVNLYYCGDYEYSSDFLSDMRSKALDYVVDHYYGNDVSYDPAWWGRVTPFDGPAYYDGAWEVYQ